MNQFQKQIASTLLYYHLIDRPLSSVELFKFLNGSGQPLKFSQFLKNLEQSKILASLTSKFQGFYFFKEVNVKSLFALRQKRVKISQLKWKRVKKVAKVLQIVPFLQMIGVTGSLTLDNANQQSDFDFLIILKPGRLWIGRTALTLLVEALGWRRHNQKTKNRVCLNCYLASPDLEIKPFIKPHDLHSAQEYGRLIPIWQAEKNIFARFRAANHWLKDFLIHYPWPTEKNLKTVGSSRLLASLRRSLEWLLQSRLGDWLETWLAGWQTKRIKHKLSDKTPADQIYFSNQCLMFHPQSKSLKLLNLHQIKLKELTGAKKHFYENTN